MARVRAELSPDELLALWELEWLADNSVIYKDNTWILKEVALGAADTYFKSNGTTWTPTFEAVSAWWAFETTSNITSNTPWALWTDDFVFGSDSLDDDWNSAHDSRMFFDKSLWSFRAWTVYSTEWDSASIWIGSTAMGKSTTASWNYSLAMGKSTTASWWYSLAMGQSTTASQNYATAVWYSTIASWVYSTVMWYRTNANGTSSLVTWQEYIDSNNHIISVWYWTWITDTTWTAIRLEADSDQNNTKKKSIYFGQTTAPTTTTDRLYNIAWALTWNWTDLTAWGWWTPTDITVANEVTDTTCFPSFFTAATGDLWPKTNAWLSFNSATSILTATWFVWPLNWNITGDCSWNAWTVTNWVYTTDFPLNQDTTWLSWTATALATARTIAWVSFDWTANISLNNNAITNWAGYTTNVWDVTLTWTQTLTNKTLTAPIISSISNTWTLTLPTTTGTLALTTDITWINSWTNTGDNTICTSWTATTAVTLATPRTINWVSFDWSANITVTADATTLSWTSLKSTILGSSLTSVGTLLDLTVTNTIVWDINWNAWTVTNGVYTTDFPLNQDTSWNAWTVTNWVYTTDFPLNQDTTWLSATATALATARTIWWVSFDWSSNIDLPWVNTAWNQDTSGNSWTVTNWVYTTDFPLNQDTTWLSATATKLDTARTIGWVSFDWTANIDLPWVNTSWNQDTSWNSWTVTNWVYTTDFPLNQDTTGLSWTATKLETARTINWVSFDWTENITVTADANTLTWTTLKSTVINSSLTSVGTLLDLTVTNTITWDISWNSWTVTNWVYTTDFPLNQDTTWLSATATALATARTIAWVSFDWTANISLNNNAITNWAGYTTNVWDVTLTWTQTLTNKTLTAPVISSISNTWTLTLPTTTWTLALTSNITWTNSWTNTWDEIVAIWTELDTWTDDVKYASAKAIKDSKNVPSVVPWTDWNILTSNWTDWISETPSELTVTESFVIAISDETTAITTWTAKVTFRMPYAFTVTWVRASLTTASTSWLPKFDINEWWTSILSTEITIDATELTSTTATTAPVISDSSLADDAQITIDIDTAGTWAKGAKIYLIGHQ